MLALEYLFVVSSSSELLDLLPSSMYHIAKDKGVRLDKNYCEI